MASAPSNEEIQVRAYELYLQCGCDGGHDLQHWLDAENELNEAYGNEARAEENRGAKLEMQEFKAGTDSTSTEQTTSTEEVPVTSSASSSRGTKTAAAGRDRR
jgi:hypothetical protein